MSIQPPVESFQPSAPKDVAAFDLAPKASVIRSEKEAIEIAHKLADDFAKGAAERDRNRILPVAELDAFSKSGLWAVTVPKEYGGLGASIITLTEIIKTISAADPNLGQLPQNHLAALDAIRYAGSEEQKKLWFGRVLKGYRLGNAFSVANSKHVGAFETTLRRIGDDQYV